MTEPHDLIVELREDVTVAARRLRASTDAGEMRRMFRLGLATLYTWRNAVRPDGVRFRDQSPSGASLEDLIELRGIYEHELLTARESPLVVGDVLPGEGLVPSDDRYVWAVIIRVDLDVDEWPTVKARAYEALRGREAPDLLEAAARFLDGASV